MSAIISREGTDFFRKMRIVLSKDGFELIAFYNEIMFPIPEEKVLKAELKTLAPNRI